MKGAADNGKGGATASDFKFTSNEQLKETVGEGGCRASRLLTRNVTLGHQYNNFNLVTLLFDDRCVDFARKSQRVLSSVSIFLEILLIVIESNREEARIFPQNLPIIFAFVGLGFNSTLLIGPILNYRQTRQPEDSNSGDNVIFQNLCASQGFLWQFFAMSALFWYFAFTNIMYYIIVKKDKISHLERKKRKYYSLGFLIPFITSFLPLYFDAYKPRTVGFPEGSGSLECWLDDPYWQLGMTVSWMLFCVVWGGYRGYYIILTLLKTKYKTEKSREKGAMDGKRGHALIGMMKEHLRRQIFLLAIFFIFSFINITYYVWMWAHDNSSRFGGCFITVMWAVNVSMLGVTLFIVFGITHENVKGGIMFWRSVTDMVKRGSSEEMQSAHTSYKGGEMVEEALDIENGIRQALKGKINQGRKGGMASVKTNHSALLAQELPGTRDQKGMIKTHLGTKIGVNLGGIKAPIEDCASAYNKFAVSGTSMPPKNHPMAEKMEAQREKYTKDVLSYVMERIAPLEVKVEREVVMSFMDEIEAESHTIFNTSILDESRMSEDWVGEDMLDVVDIDERLKMAKAKFEEALK